jgi:hypothetical protein
VTRQDAFDLFHAAVVAVWKNAEFVLPALAWSEEPAVGGSELASVTFDHRGVWASGRSLLSRAPKYTLRVSDALLAMPREKVAAIMLHEAIHLGYPGHGEEFRKIAREVGAPVSASAVDRGDTIEIQKKVGSRYKTVRTFPGSEEREAIRWAKEQARAEPGSRWRMQQ